MTTKEMVPVVKRVDKSTIYLCKPEFDLLCWIRRELGLIKVKQSKKHIMNVIFGIVSTMNNRFDNWPEDPK